MGILNMIKYSCCGLFYKKGAAIWQTGFHLTVLLLKTQLAVKIELQKKRAMRQPIARFNVKTGEVYMEHGDGSRTIVGQAMKRGRYSEREARKPEG